MSDLRPIPRTQASYILELLKVRRTRDRERVFVLEGAKPILELVEHVPQKIVTLVLSPTFLERQSPAMQDRLLSGPYQTYMSPDTRFAQLSDVESPAGILAIVRQPHWDEAAILSRKTILGLYGDRLQDPTNLGTIVRTAAGLGLDALWLSPNSVDVFNPKVVRATAGTLFHLPIFQRTELGALLSDGMTVVTADSQTTGSKPIRNWRSRHAKTLLAIGSESEGLSPTVRSHAHLSITIPLNKWVESLNVAAAAAIVLYHASSLPIEE
ncbi:MAG: RNA methyltransferase [Nitrospiraceae bacterium]|nr:RNA methyltransferase [Nitrospiraceae bacterium]